MKVARDSERETNKTRKKAKDTFDDRTATLKKMGMCSLLLIHTFAPCVYLFVHRIGMNDLMTPSC